MIARCDAILVVGPKFPVKGPEVRDSRMLDFTGCERVPETAHALKARLADI